MQNITGSSSEENINIHKDMPSVGEFFSAKMTDAFSSLGESFGKGKERLNLKKELFSANAELETEAKAIGRYVIGEVSNGRESILVPQEFIEQIRVLKSKIEKKKKKKDALQTTARRASC